MPRRRSSFLAALALPFTFAACEVTPAAKEDSAAQLGVISDTVQISTTVCPVDVERQIESMTGPSVPACLSRDEVLAGFMRTPGDPDRLESEPQQFLLAFRVPAGATAPETITSTVEVYGAAPPAPGGSVGQPTTEQEVTFTRSDELESKVPDFIADLVQRTTGTPLDAPLVAAGQQLVGYTSEPLLGSPVDEFTVTADFDFPETERDEPFNRLVLVGTRLSPVPGSPIVCYAGQEPVTRQVLYRGTVCPVPSTFDGEELVPALAGADLGLRRLSLAGGEATVAAGQSIDVPFEVRLRGPAAPADAPPLALTGATPLPGATAAPRDASLAIPDGAAAQPVRVTVPADAAPGTYEVELTARLGEERRRATALLRVTPAVTVPGPPASAAPPSPPSPVAAQSRTMNNLYMDRDRNVPFGYVCPLSLQAACATGQADLLVRFGALAPRASQAQRARLLRLGRNAFAGRPGSRVRPKVRVGPKAAAALRSGRALTGLLVVRSGKDGAPHVRRVTLRKRKG